MRLVLFFCFIGLGPQQKIQSFSRASCYNNWDSTTIEIYESESAFAEDVIKAYVEFVNEIYAAGCRNLQFDDCVQCGFASCEIGNKLTEEEQWEKLRLVKEIAEEVWG